jgi:hypothetical protein
LWPWERWLDFVRLPFAPLPLWCVVSLDPLLLWCSLGFELD